MKPAKLERQKLLVAKISGNPGILIRDLAKHLGVSRETVRRDFDELCREGRLHRRYGGATFSPIGLETSLEKRQEQHIGERMQIAELASTLISANEVVMLGSGATTLELARILAAGDTSLTIITNSIKAAMVLGPNKLIRTLLAPGEYDSQEGFLWGHETTEFLEKLHVDLVVFSVDGLSSMGVMEIDSRTTWILRTMVAQARRRMLLVDHSKHHQKSLGLVCSLADMDVVVTDKMPDNELLSALQTDGVIIEIAT